MEFELDRFFCSGIMGMVDLGDYFLSDEVIEGFNLRSSSRKSWIGIVFYDFGFF